jgi:hypothetical protein
MRRKHFLSVFGERKNVSAQQGSTKLKYLGVYILDNPELLRQFLLRVNAVENVLEERTKLVDLSLLA